VSSAELVAASAGPLGDDVRSDTHVAFVPGTAPLEISVKSKVDYLYGTAIEAAIRRVTAALDVTTGSLTVTDGGALEWVLLARTEACLRRAGCDGAGVLPEPAPGASAPRRRERLRRSRLYVPGNRPKLMISAGLYDADGVILDLEDSVPPADKDLARVLVRNALVALDWGSSERMVRINQGPHGDRDLEAIAPHNVHVVLLPKVEDPDQVRHAAGRLRSLTGGEPLADDEPPFLMPILESPQGVHRAYSIAAADETVVALTLGLEDLSAELGAPRTAEATESFLARQTTVYAARAAAVQPIASVYSDIQNEQGLAEYIRRERALGFDGIGCIHPRQIPVVHKEMTPAQEEVDRAMRIVRAAREAEARGLGAVAVGSKMVDRPVVKQAYRTVELAVSGGVLDPGWDE
jgi:citrate lyase subunit beta/citryl-CoA lyase